MKETVKFKMNANVKKIIIIKFTIFLLFIIFCSPSNFFINFTNAINISSDLDSSTYLQLSIIEELNPRPPTIKLEPIINWYDLQTMDNKSVLNSKINVNQEYKFCINITSNQGWVDIDYINITAWFDNADDKSTYNPLSNFEALV